MVLLTGATGFLGSALLPRLAEREEVLAMHPPERDPRPLDGVRWIAQDLTAPLSPELPERIDAVIHLAQSRRHREFPEGAVDVHEVNAAATVRLLDYCWRAGGTTFTYASTGGVYAPGPEPVRESDVPQPINFYATSKLAGERAVERFRAILRGHCLRFFFIYGPGQRNMFIPGLISRIGEGREVTLAGADGIHMNPVYVQDAADAVLATLDLEESGTFNVAGPEVVSVRRIAERIGGLLDRAPRFAVGDPQPDLVACAELRDAILGAARVGVEEGLRRAVEAPAPRVVEAAVPRVAEAPQPRAVEAG
jgi:UDP-glucose 4-epimerase